MNKTVLGIIAVVVVLIVGNGLYAYLNNTPNTERIPVSKFNDGKDGYSIAIPTGDTSTCTWNYTGGNAAIPYSKTTEAQTATEKHTVYVDDYYDWIVTCSDDLGNHYTGIFPRR
jgi:hypothetical protein